ncbi:hypothetical protein MNV49_004977 [Pseudohyphozyma bogoriensis]|nr:hypothetical protein MNV49_004977 [Pseudohyphozyma bogoriensis]
MASSSGETTVTILDARLRLVHIPRGDLQKLMAPIVDCWFFRGEKDPFFALSGNGVEVSLFADADVVERTFGSFMTTHDETDVEEEVAGESVITLGGAAQRRDEGGGADHNKVLVGDDVWMALEIAFSGDGWESAGQRVRDISAPLADEGISILFLSTYISDYILVRADKLEQVTSILEGSGFTFADHDDDDDLDRGHSADRQFDRARGASTSTYGSGGRKGSTSGSMQGSLVLSDRGSVGGSPAGSSRGATLSRSGSLGSRTTAMRPSTAVRKDGDEVSPLSSANLSPASSAPPSPPAQPLALLPEDPSQSASTPRKSRPITSNRGLTVLPDELVCVGLNGAHEELWKAKILQALFYPERVLPPTKSQKTHMASSKSSGAPRPGTMSLSASVHSITSQAAGMSDVKMAASMHSETSQLSTPRAGSSAEARHPAPGTTLRHDSMSSSTSSESSRSSSPLDASRKLSSTSKSEYPIPFIGLTQTPDGTSLTADVRLLRAIFKESEEAEMVYAVGNGGLRGIWQGEDDEEEEDENVESLRRKMEKLARRERGRSARRSEGGQSDDDVLADDSESDDDDDDESEAVEEEWQKVEREDARRERRERAKEAEEGGRVLLKAIEIPLTETSIDQSGVVGYFADLLLKNDVNCLYSSTYLAANILVAKSDILRASQILIQHELAQATA